MIEIGQAAVQDPVLNFTSAVATQLLTMAAAQRPARRQQWLRDDLNKATPGLGDEFVSKQRELRRRGRTPDQAVFDALRLVLANRVAARLPGAGLSGLGESAGDISAVFCGINGTVGGASLIISSTQQDPASMTAAGASMAAILQAQGCSNAALQAQAAATQAQLAALAAGGASVTVDASSDALPWIIGGVAMVGLVGVLGYLAVRKKA